MKAEHLDEQPSITNIDDELDKIISEAMQGGFDSAMAGSPLNTDQQNEDLQNKFYEEAMTTAKKAIANKIKEAELRIFEVCERNVADPQIKTEGYFKVNIALLKQQLTNQHKGEQDNE